MKWTRYLLPTAIGLASAGTIAFLALFAGLMIAIGLGTFNLDIDAPPGRKEFDILAAAVILMGAGTACAAGWQVFALLCRRQERKLLLRAS